MSTFPGTYATGLSISDTASSPVTIGGSGSISSLSGGIALYGESQAGHPDYHFPWDITNLGRITAVGSTSTGILLEGGGSVTNGQVGTPGYISGGVQGISVAQLQGTVINFGSIVASSTNGSGVFLHAGGIVTNTGLITGGTVGVHIGGTLGTVVNYGAIRSSNTFFGYGVILEASTSNFLSNSAIGYIGGTAGVGVLGTVGPTTIVNSGTIAEGIFLTAGGQISNGQTNSTNGRIAGMSIRGGSGAVANYGTISGFLYSVELTGGGSVLNGQPGALITATNDGVIIYGGSTAAVTNLGTISVAGTDGGAGVLLSTGGTVVNGSVGVGSLIIDNAFSKDKGVEIDGAAGLVTNFGTVDGGYGVFLRAGGTVANTAAFASITGQYFGVIVNPGTLSANLITNLGLIKAIGANNNPGFGSIGARIAGSGTVINGAPTNVGAVIKADASGITGGGGGTRGFGVVIDAVGTLVNYGTVTGTRVGADLFGGGNITNGSSATGAALISGGYYGVIGSQTGTTGLTITNFGTIAGATNTAIGLGTVGNNRLVIEPGSTLQGVVHGFHVGDTIDLPFKVLDPAGTASLDPVTHSLSIVENGAIFTVALDPNDSFTGDSFVLSNDGNGKTLVTEVCFCRGTSIETEHGDVPVEDLKVGDRVRTLSGKLKPIVWIGLGRSLVTRANKLTRPVIVRAGALADNVPSRDLYLTHGHALYLDGVLIPVENLVNHRSILWDERARVVEYYHVELEDHDVVVANGAPAESYYDAKNRAQFQNMRPGSAPGAARPTFAPVLNGGAIVEAVWAKLSARAGGSIACDTTDDPDLHLATDGRRLDATTVGGALYRFALAAPPAAPLHLRSRSGVPSLLGITAHDHRRLGVALARIVISQPGVTTVIESDAPVLLAGGAHPAEAGYAWTDGDLTLPPSLFAHLQGIFTLTVHTERPGMRYPVEPMTAIAA